MKACYLVVLTLCRASAWYGGYLPRIPDFRLFLLRPLNVVGRSVQFTCSAAHRGDAHILWSLRHPDKTFVEPTISMRTLSVGQNVSVTDSRLELTAARPHDGIVDCSVQANGQLARLSAGYRLLPSVSSLDCWQYKSCNARTSTCRVTGTTSIDCVCKSGFPYHDAFHGVCLAGALLNQACVFDHECRAASSVCRDGLCRCRTGFSTDGDSCFREAALGRACDNATRCVSRWTRCLGGTCRCEAGRPLDGACVEGHAGQDAGLHLIRGALFIALCIFAARQAMKCAD